MHVPVEELSSVTKNTKQHVFAITAFIMNKHEQQIIRDDRMISSKCIKLLFTKEAAMQELFARNDVD